MKVEVWAIGKTSEPYLETGIAIYEKRIKNYLPFAMQVIPNAKIRTTEATATKNEEAKLVLSKLQPDDYLILLDERGDPYSSTELAQWMEKRLSGSHRRLVFLIGGAFGFNADVYARANAQWSLSKLTFSHQMVRLFLLEQLYRAMTILKNEPYHNN